MSETRPATFIDYARTCGIATEQTPAGWIAGEPELLADPRQRALLTPAPTEEAALVAHWDASTTELLDERDVMSAAYAEVMEALLDAGLDVRALPADQPGCYRYSYAWHEGRWSADYPSEGAAITAALQAQRGGSW
jgi:hypothetical protein